MAKITVELNDDTYCQLKAYAKAMCAYAERKETYKDTAEWIIRMEVGGQDKIFQGEPESLIFEKEYKRQKQLLIKK